MQAPSGGMATWREWSALQYELDKRALDALGAEEEIPETAIRVRCSLAERIAIEDRAWQAFQAEQAGGSWVA
jgi:hypothetical protein